MCAKFHENGACTFLRNLVQRETKESLNERTPVKLPL